MGMNQEASLEGDGNFIVGYATRDFDFILAAMAMDHSRFKIRVQGCVPVPRQRGRMDQVRFHLAAYEDGRPLLNSVSFFEQLRLQYQNNELRINPRKYSEMARTLRSMSIDVLERARDAASGTPREGSRP